LAAVNCARSCPGAQASRPAVQDSCFFVCVANLVCHVSCRHAKPRMWMPPSKGSGRACSRRSTWRSERRGRQPRLAKLVGLRFCLICIQFVEICTLSPCAHSAHLHVLWTSCYDRTLAASGCLGFCLTRLSPGRVDKLLPSGTTAWSLLVMQAAWHFMSLLLVKQFLFYRASMCCLHSVSSCN